MAADEFEQCHLWFGTSHLVCLLPAGAVSVGDGVTLKDSPYPGRVWTVVEVGQPIRQEFVHYVQRLPLT